MVEEKYVYPEDRKKSESEEHPGRFPPWLITYSDLITLLLTFFILMMSMANLDPVRFTKASSSLKDAFGIKTRPSIIDRAVPIIPSPLDTQIQPSLIEMTDSIYPQINSRLEELKLTQDAETILTDSDTITLRLKDTFLFNPGEDELDPRSYPLLEDLADIIRPYPILLRIEGHTDDIETTTDKFPDSWELSVARAVAITRFFKHHKLLDLDRLSAIGYGSKRPIVENSSDANRAQNRRVDFILQATLSSGTSPAVDHRSALPL